jgi:hypothetical protein
MRLAAVLALAAVSGCVAVTYQRAGEHITPRAGQTLVFGRLRFFHDGREFFPWSVSLAQSGVATRTERHVWFLRLGRRAVSAEVHPDPDGSLAIWLASGDYALLGSTQVLTSGSPPYEVAALFRVPAGPVATYVGELTMTTESHEGAHLSYTELGETSVTLLPIDIARATLEQRLGTLPEAPALSPWCAGEHLPGFHDSKLAARGKELLDSGCAGASRQSLGSAQADTSNPARIAIYGIGDAILGHLTLRTSTPADARRILEPHGGLGPARDNEVTFHIGSATMRPRLLYTPPGTMQQLYFQKDTLVLVVDGIPHDLPSTRLEFMGRFPKARETHRESGWYELQTSLSECVWLIAVFRTNTDTLESNAYAGTCDVTS